MHKGRNYHPCREVKLDEDNDVDCTIKIFESGAPEEHCTFLQECEEFKMALNVTMVEKEMNILRSSFRKEALSVFNQALSNQASGSSTRPTYAQEVLSDA